MWKHPSYFLFWKLLLCKNLTTNKQTCMVFVYQLKSIWPTDSYNVLRVCISGHYMCRILKCLHFEFYVVTSPRTSSFSVLWYARLLFYLLFDARFGVVFKRLWCCRNCCSFFFLVTKCASLVYFAVETETWQCLKTKCSFYVVLKCILIVRQNILINVDEKYKRNHLISTCIQNECILYNKIYENN